MTQKSNIVKLDKKDRKIIYALDFDGRATLSAIARQVGLSKQGVEYKISSLVKKGVITKFYPMININRLGFFYCRFFFKLQNMSRKREGTIIKETIGHKKCVWAIRLEGNYDFAISFALDSLSEFKEISEYLLGRYGKYIKEKKESIAIDVVHFQSRFLLPNKTSKEAVMGEGEKEFLDDIDWKILRILCKNGRIPLVKIAEKLKVSPKTISARIKNMEQNSIILGYRPDIDHSLIGYDYYKILFHLSNVTKEEYQKFRAYLKSLPSLLYIVDEIGISDIDIEIVLPKQKRIFEFIQELRYKFPHLIKDYETMLVTKTLKVIYLPEE